MLLSIVVVFAIVLAVFALLFRRLLRRGHTDPIDPLDWLEEFSPATYRPMERLLDDRDYTFLAAQPGFEPSIARTLRRQRLAIFQSYLRGMIRDFHRLLQIARVVSAYANDDQSAFESALWGLRFRFYAAIASVEMQVAMNILGVGQVDARRLLAALEQVQVSTLRLCPAAEA